MRFTVQLVEPTIGEKLVQSSFVKGLQGYLQDRVPAHVLVNVWEDETTIHVSLTGDPLQPPKRASIGRSPAINMGWEDAGSYLLKKLKAR